MTGKRRRSVCKPSCPEAALQFFKSSVPRTFAFCRRAALAHMRHTDFCATAAAWAWLGADRGQPGQLGCLRELSVQPKARAAPGHEPTDPLSQRPTDILPLGSRHRHRPAGWGRELAYVSTSRDRAGPYSGLASGEQALLGLFLIPAELPQSTDMHQMIK